jgi:hypothetical protein
VAVERVTRCNNCNNRPRSGRIRGLFLSDQGWQPPRPRSRWRRLIAISSEPGRATANSAPIATAITWRLAVLNCKWLLILLLILPAMSDITGPAFTPEGAIPAPMIMAAALWVMLYHLWRFGARASVTFGPVYLTPILACGAFGAELFLVLSAFLVGEPLVRARVNRAHMPGPANFWHWRLRRVLPAYWCQQLILTAIGFVTGVAAEWSRPGCTSTAPRSVGGGHYRSLAFR